MAQKTIVVNASASLTARGQTTATGSITWTAPALPAGVAAWDGVRISGKWTWGGKGSISRVTINGTNTSDGVSFDVDISGKSSPLSITCAGNKNATGSSFTWTSLQVTYTYTEENLDPPIITVRTPSRSRISDESGYDQCRCDFTSDKDLSQWEARATKAGVTPARGVGLLVESGGALSAGAAATVIVDDEELTGGEGEYTITVYGCSTGGVWSA